VEGRMQGTMTAKILEREVVVAGGVVNQLKQQR